MKVAALLLMCVILYFALSNNLFGQINQITVKAIENNSSDQDEASVSADPTNAQHLMATWNDWRSDIKPGYGFSTDGGVSWQRGLITPDASHAFGVDPSCAFDKLGNAFYSYVALPGTNGNGPTADFGPMYVSHTTDNGVHWVSNPVATSNNTMQDKPFITVGSNNKVYACWTDFWGSNANQTTTTIYFAYSTNQGTSFSTPYEIAKYGVGAPDSGGNSLSPLAISSAALYPFVQGSSIAVDPSGMIYVTYLDAYDQSQTKLKIRRSTNGGTSFEAPISITANPINIAWKISVGGPLRVSSFPTIIVDPVTHNIYVAFTQNDRVGSVDNLNIYHCLSSDSGQTWSSPQISTQSTVNHQFFPWLSASVCGTVSLAYYQGTSTSVDAYLAQLSGGAQSFSTPNTRISDVSSNPNNISSVHYADYIGIASASSDEVFPVWSDFRSTSSDIYTAIVQYTAAPLPTPTLLSPTNNSTLCQMVLSWNQSGGAEAYRLQVANNSVFTNPLIDTSGITSTSCSLSSLAGNTTYYWRVYSMSSICGSTASGAWQFTTPATPPSTPSLSGTTFNISHTLAYPILTWTSSGCNITYKLYRRWCVPDDCSGFSRTDLVYTGSALIDTDHVDLVREGDTYMSYNYYVIAVANTNQQASASSNEVQYIVADDFSKPGLRTRVGENTIKATSLSANHPNPFNPTTTIFYTIANVDHVRLTIYDMLGREMATLVDEMKNAGQYSASWDAESLPSGIYICRLSAGKFLETRKMILMR